MGGEETGLILVLSFRDIQEDRSSVKKNPDFKENTGAEARSLDMKEFGGI